MRGWCDEQFGEEKAIALLFSGPAAEQITEGRQDPAQSGRCHWLKNNVSFCQKNVPLYRILISGQLAKELVCVNIKF